jgi:hypothetical protein
MNGSNSLPELDRRPLDLCPACTAKLCLARGLDPVRREQELAAALEAAGLTAEARVAEERARLLAGGARD